MACQSSHLTVVWLLAQFPDGSFLVVDAVGFGELWRGGHVVVVCSDVAAGGLVPRRMGCVLIFVARVWMSV